MTRFPPQSSLLTSVKMTRTAYAQLMGQKFFPPKIFGQFKEPEGTNELRWREVGMKIVRTKTFWHWAERSLLLYQAVGFEMLYQESKGRTNTNISAETTNASVSFSLYKAVSGNDTHTFPHFRLRPTKRPYAVTLITRNTSNLWRLLAISKAKFRDQSSGIH